MSHESVTSQEFQQILDKMCLYFFLPHRNQVFNFKLSSKQKEKQFYSLLLADYKDKLRSVTPKQYQEIKSQVIQQVEQVRDQKSTYLEFFS